KMDTNANGYRLPTEAEWEYAAKGGSKSKGYKYSGSNNAEDVAWYDYNSASRTHPVGQKRPNELGIYDMSGNVWEWCWDCDENYNSDAQINPAGSLSGRYRVVRGGSWYSGIRYLRPTFRNYYIPDYMDKILGLRLARSK
ncbi:MAG: formylglycine-generating enzyme family protein, partial [Ignavibacteriaceae bacterium]|nr:formylglycine-generating enzyme family protein [Ignavibacteriaceae bacterium]